MMKGTIGRAGAGVLCALGCETLYGLSYVFTKLANSAGADGLELLAWRFWAAFAFLATSAETL